MWSGLHVFAQHMSGSAPIWPQKEGEERRPRRMEFISRWVRGLRRSKGFQVVRGGIAVFEREPGFRASSRAAFSTDFSIRGFTSTARMQANRGPQSQGGHTHLIPPSRRIWWQQHQLLFSIAPKGLTGAAGEGGKACRGPAR